MRWILLLFVCIGGARAEDIDFDALVQIAFTRADNESERAAQKTAFATFKENKADAVAALMKQAHLRHNQIGYYAGFYSRHTSSNEVGRLNRALAPFLESAHARTRSRAAFCLSLHPESDYIPKVLPLLEDDETAGNALHFLGKAKARDALDEILPFAKHERERLRIYAVNALREIGDVRAVPALLQAADDGMFTVRRAALAALSAIGPEARPAIRAQLDRASPRARRGLNEVLEEKD